MRKRTKAGIVVGLIVALLAANEVATKKLFSTEVDGERHTSMECRPGQEMVFGKPGLYWKNCERPILLYAFGRKN